MTEKKKRWRPSLTAYRDMETECNTLKQSNVLMEAELDRLRRLIESMKNVIDDKNMIIIHLKNRSFLERVFNW